MVEIVGGQGERAVDGGALEFVGGQGVAVVDPAGVEVPVGETDLATGVELDGERATVEVDGDDDATVAVVDIEAAVVAQEHHAIADGEGAIIGGDFVVAESAAVAHEGMGVGVELGDMAAGQRDQDGLLVGMALDSAPPVGELGVALPRSGLSATVMRPRWCSKKT